ncbi:3582_t:CDS:2, partial [Ambispora gerdemannii]
SSGVRFSGRNQLNCQVVCQTFYHYRFELKTMTNKTPNFDAPPPYSAATEQEQSSLVPRVLETSPLYPNVPKNSYNSIPNLYYNPTPPPIAESSSSSAAAAAGYAPLPDTVILPAPVSLQSLRDEPAVTICPRCKNRVLSIVSYDSGSATWLASCMLFVLGITMWGCCLVPFCVNDLKDCNHACPSCGRTMARYSRLHGTVEVYVPRSRN